MGNVFDEMEKLNNPTIVVGDPKSTDVGELYSTPTLPTSVINDKPRKSDTTVSRQHATKTPHMAPSHRDATVSRHPDKFVDHIRKTVREIGKEAATHRFTVAEKRAINEVVHRYNQQGIKTSENEVARIAINFILSDHESAGKDSVLDQVIRKLNE